MQKARGLDVRPEDLADAGKRSEFTVCVVGLGRMGLPTACIWADAGFEVVGVDINMAVVEAVNSGKAPFEEPGLSELLASVVEKGKLTATTDARDASSRSDVIEIITPTPVGPDGRPDYGPIRKACSEVGLGLRPGSLIVVESTVGPGTTEGLLRETLEKASGLKAGEDFGLAYSPIRATSGRVLRDLVEYPRVLGAINERSLEAAKAFFSTVVKGGVVVVPDMKTAELTKLAENFYRQVVLSLTNELALLCEKVGVDFYEVARAANTQPYCRLLRPGLVGGHLPKDLQLFIAEAEDAGAELRLGKAAKKVNDGLVKHVLKLAREALRDCGKSLRRAKVVVLGISYKPDVKNPRGSRSLELVRELEKRCRAVVAYDPFYTKQEMEELGYPAASSLTEALSGADCAIIAVGHSKFRELGLKVLKDLMAEKAAIVDAAGLVEPDEARRQGFAYRGFGRPHGP